MNYRDTLDSLEYPVDRAHETAQDIREILNDDSIFGELIANSVGEAIARMIDKSGLDNFVNGGIDNAKSMVNDSLQGAVQGAIKSEKFTTELAEALAVKEVGRDLDDFHKNDKEMEP